MRDGELLAKYVGGDQEAFAALVRQYVDMVHAAARRQAAEHADDVTQAVFILLARKARGLRGRASVAGWLLTATRLCAGRARRSDMRRKFYEREAGMRTADSEGETAELLAMLDAGLEAMPAGEREMVIGRHLRGKALEVMAAEMGVSVPAATKRVQRALERLRGIFARRGKSVGAVVLTGILAAEAGHRAPAALAGSVPSGAATAIANSAATVMAAGKALVGAMLVLLVLGGGATAGILFQRGRPATSGTREVIAATTIQVEFVPESAPMLASFDLAMDEAVAEKLRAIATPVKTESESYAAYRASNDELQAVLREAEATGALYATDDHNVSFDRPHGTSQEQSQALDRYNTTFFGDRGGTIWLASSTASKGGGKIQGKGSGLSLDVDFPAAGVSTATQTIGSQNLEGAVRYRGEIVAGESIFFLRAAAPVGGETPWHGIFWQAFGATQDQAAAVVKIDTLKGWIPRGPDRTLAQADRALVWRNSRASDIGKMPIPRAGGVRTLANGAEVRMVAIGRPQEYPFCWWSAEGRPIARDWTGHDAPLESVRAVVVEFSAPAFSHPNWSASDFFGISDPIRYYAAAKAEVTWVVDAPVESVRVGMSCGPWEDIGTLAGVGEMHKGDVAFKITNIYPIEGIHGVMPVGQFRAPLEVDVRLLAVDKAGARHDWLTEEDRRIKGEDGETVGIMINPPAVEWQRLDPNFTVRPEEVDRYVVQTRKREWVTFEHLPDVPAVEIPAKVSAEEVAAAREQVAAEKKVTTKEGK